MSISQNEWQIMDMDKKCLVRAIINLLNNHGFKPIIESNRAYLLIWLHSSICINVFENGSSFRVRSYQASRELNDVRVNRNYYLENALETYQISQSVVYLVKNTCIIASTETSNSENICKITELAFCP